MWNYLEIKMIRSHRCGWLGNGQGLLVLGPESSSTALLREPKGFPKGRNCDEAQQP